MLRTLSMVTSGLSSMMRKCANRKTLPTRWRTFTSIAESNEQDDDLGFLDWVEEILLL